MIGHRMILVANRLEAATLTAPDLIRGRRRQSTRQSPSAAAAAAVEVAREGEDGPPAETAEPPDDVVEVVVDATASSSLPLPDRRALFASRDRELICALSMRPRRGGSAIALDSSRRADGRGDDNDDRASLIAALSRHNLESMKRSMTAIPEVARLSTIVSDDEEEDKTKTTRPLVHGESVASSVGVIERMWPRIRTGWMLALSLVLYIAFGWAVYCLAPGNRLSAIDGYFESITIGYSVGMAPRNPLYQPDPWFSTWHILSGAALIAILLTKAGENVEEDASMNMFDALRRHEDYERKMRVENPLPTRVSAFVRYNAAYLMTIALWIMWMGFIVGWSIIATSGLDDPSQRWSFDRAQYFAVSLCSSAGSMSLPPDSPEWAYLLAGVSMMIGVPLMALAVSCVVIMMWQNQRFRRVHDAAWEPIKDVEMEALRSLQLMGEDETEMTKSGFVLLGLLRMGQDGGIIGYLSDAYDARGDSDGRVYDRGA
ncbi:hypothetical protein ACHAXA_006778 [Cyclostephanos tholiformis]|uniref:Potassium channel domain-containing protein n=1 Tax=Cyclostephanos tholiformis TaxID=382380 RepID=A0ABD3R3C6_9STRA